MQIFHGSTQIVEHPEVRVSKYNKDFYFGFYCTSIEQQAIRWATRFGEGFVNVYDYKEDPSLNILRFEKMTDEWLDFIVACRQGVKHDYDVTTHQICFSTQNAISSLTFVTAREVHD
ncbi:MULTISPECIES: DUF3990 domain-containing protein [unclassified Fibrobacter]|uniref:DUF3990 domain-containing protein n=1 Tax=unclassified Fibrobacter TaxID=2634177 RepID=UPI000B523739|nr:MULTISPECIES: DUF3990 domain-containing protein [Fibrobacter]MCL4101804.1 hypothetical protein [Fibrobacter succinogenes]OWV06171.1 hypothetical protein B7993_06330 [Fibrobacter sp. UWH3]